MTTEDLLSAFTSPMLQEGAHNEGIQQLKQIAGGKLPRSYLDLMSVTNGIEGFVSDSNYVILWPVEHLPEANEGYGVTEFTPGFFLFGSNGGDAGYVFDTRCDPMPVLEVPFIDMSYRGAKQVGSTFSEFIRDLHKQD